MITDLSNGQENAINEDALEANMTNDEPLFTNNEDDDIVVVDELESNPLIPTTQENDPAPASDAAPTRDSLFSKAKEDPKNDVTEDDIDDDGIDLERLNKKLNTNFKSKEEMFEKLGVERQQNEFQQDEAKLSDAQVKFDHCERYLQMDDEALVKESLIAQAAAEKKDINSAEVLEEIEDQLDGLKSLKQIKTQASLIRTNVKSQQEAAKGTISGIEKKREDAQAEIARKNTMELENALAEFYEQKEFFGVTLTEEAIREAYTDLQKGTWAQAVNKDQRRLAKLVLLDKFSDLILKQVANPTRSDKARDFLSPGSQKAQNQTGRSIATASGTSSHGGKNLVDEWLR